jgi:glycogen(starch) synthase
MAPENFIEVSFEVSNKVGGIYQVLKSKSTKMNEYYSDGYLTIGFYNEENAMSDFAPREENPYEYIFDEMKEEIGVECHYGAWNIKGSPRTILIDISDAEIDVDEIKSHLWEEYSIDSLNAGDDFEEPLKWSYAVGRLVDKLEDELEGETVMQLHEWLSAPAMFENEVPTVFTTHATVLGRALSNSDYDLRSAVERGSVEQSKAEEFGVKSKHQMEKTAAEEAEVFTTVSKTTGKEASAVLGVEPDKILPNGFNVEEFPSLEELSYQHTKKKKEVKEFLRAYFKPYYDVELEDDPRVMFISGRYEFHNKGIDTFIDALSKVNEKEGEDFFVFFFVPSDVKGEKLEVLENVSLYEELEDHVEEAIPEIKNNILDSVTSGEEALANMEEVFNSRTPQLKNLERNFRAKQGEKPPMSAFDLNYDNDDILERLYDKGLRNRKSDRVKVVFYPTYLSVGDKLLSMSYHDAMVASSAGIFPSYYEPWGYTPVETAANGALSVTTDLAGFGKFLMEKTDPEERKGIRVIEREDKSDEEATEQLADTIQDIVQFSKTEITERKHNARKLAQMTSWEKLGENYKEAHEMAVENK